MIRWNFYIIFLYYIIIYYIFFIRTFQAPGFGSKAETVVPNKFWIWCLGLNIVTTFRFVFISLSLSWKRMREKYTFRRERKRVLILIRIVKWRCERSWYHFVWNNNHQRDKHLILFTFYPFQKVFYFLSSSHLFLSPSLFLITRSTFDQSSHHHLNSNLKWCDVYRVEGSEKEGME